MEEKSGSTRGRPKKRPAPTEDPPPAAPAAPAPPPEDLELKQRQRREFAQRRPRRFQRGLGQVQLLSGRLLSMPTWFSNQPCQFEHRRTTHLSMNLEDLEHRLLSLGPGISTGQRGRPPNPEKLAQKYVKKPFPCPRPNCLKSFADEGSLKKHIALGHDTKRFICRIESCNREFPSRLELSRHQMIDHKQRRDQQQQLKLQAAAAAAAAAVSNHNNNGANAEESTTVS